MPTKTIVACDHLDNCLTCNKRVLDDNSALQETVGILRAGRAAKKPPTNHIALRTLIETIKDDIADPEGKDAVREVAELLLPLIPHEPTRTTDVEVIDFRAAVRWSGAWPTVLVWQNLTTGQQVDTVGGVEPRHLTDRMSIAVQRG